METVKESLKENIKRLALRNLDKEPIFNHEKEKLGEVHDELNRVQDEYKTMKQIYGSIVQNGMTFETIFFSPILEEQTCETNPEMIWVLLQTAASELERATEVCLHV